MRLHHFLFALGCSFFWLQSQEHELIGIGFYNVENAFDAEDNPKTFDDDYTPQGRLSWTTARYHQKIDTIGSVIAGIGKENNIRGVSLLGLCEVENAKVIERLIHGQALLPFGYDYIHYDSPDRRGIDVALLYRKQHFLPVNTTRYRLRLRNQKQYAIPTRDQLVVNGMLLGEEVVVLVNHWPSRRGGQQRSAPLRRAAARLQLHILDSIFAVDREAKIIVMGDFNDNPSDKSLQLLTQAPSGYENLQPLRNPMLPMEKKGLGSLAHRDQWFLFDQLLLSNSWWSSNGFFFVGTRIHNPKRLQTPSGRYFGYPYRTQHQGAKLQGYSDHFPVYGIFARNRKEINR